MPDKKLTDSEIKKALERCLGDSCYSSECSFFEETKDGEHCQRVAIKHALDLINRQDFKIHQLEIIVGLRNNRKHYRKFVDEVYRKEKGKELSDPDFDYIYELYFKLQAENERLEKENKLLIDNDVSNKYPNCVLVEKGRIYTRTLEDYDKLIGDISTESYTDFAESLKKDFDNPRIQKFGLDFVKFLKNVVDNRLKERVGDTDV